MPLVRAGGYRGTMEVQLQRNVGPRRWSRVGIFVVAAGWTVSLAAAWSAGPPPATGAPAPILFAFLWLALGLLLAQLALICWLVRRHRSRVGVGPVRARGDGEGARFRSLVQDSHDLMQEIDADGRVVYTNPAWRDALGYHGSDTIGLSVWQVLDPAAQRAYREAWESLSRGNPVRRLRTVFRQRDGLALEVEGSLRAQAFGAGGVSSLGVFRKDVARAEAQALKRAFVRTMGHELRTPLTSLFGALDLLSGPSSGAPTGVEEGELLEIARRNGGRLLDLVNDLLDLQKLEEGLLAIHPKPCPARELLAQAVDALEDVARSENVRIVVRTEGQVSDVEADPKRLRQALRNLLSVAVRLSPGDGEVRVETSTDGDLVTFTISDSGPSYPEEISAALARETATRAAAAADGPTGYGLGLSIARRLVAAMNGQLSVAHLPEGGNRVSVELPRALPKPSRSEGPRRGPRRGEANRSAKRQPPTG